MGVDEPAVAAGSAVVGDESTEDVEEVNLLRRGYRRFLFGMGEGN